MRVWKHLGNFSPVVLVSGAQNRHFTSFFETPWTFLPRNVTEVYCYIKWAKDRLMVPGFGFFACFGVPSGSNCSVLCTDGQRGSIVPYRNAVKRHKAGPASPWASLAGLALNRWLSYLPSMVPAYWRACGGRICRTRHSVNPLLNANGVWQPVLGIGPSNGSYDRLLNPMYHRRLTMRFEESNGLGGDARSSRADGKGQLA